TANAPIIRVEESRPQPFPNIFHLVRPSASTIRRGAVLTPLKVGIVYCWMLREVLFNRQSWPGMITASIYNNNGRGGPGTLLGWINVANSRDTPRAGTKSIATSPGDDDQNNTFGPHGKFRIVATAGNGAAGELSTIPIATRERSWLDCYHQILMYLLAYPPDGSVTAALPPQPPGKRWFTAHFRSTIDAKMEGNVSIAWDNGGMTWDVLAVSMHVLLAEAAIRNKWDNIKKVELSTDEEYVANAIAEPITVNYSFLNTLSEIDLCRQAEQLVSWGKAISGGPTLSGGKACAAKLAR
ncbi:MAG: hypothetical protein Q9181_006587, partial [Wetmoreana brouardii]